MIPLDIVLFLGGLGLFMFFVLLAFAFDKWRRISEFFEKLAELVAKLLGA